MVKLIAPNGKKLRNIKTEALYSEVICDERMRPLYVPMHVITPSTSGSME